ncbi:hypothetical protein Drorol1_Dr00027128 [Drosera rotundifolia]
MPDFSKGQDLRTEAVVDVVSRHSTAIVSPDSIMALSTMSHNPPLESHEHSTEDVAVLAERARAAATTIVDISASIIQDHAVDPRMNDSLENPLYDASCMHSTYMM